MSKITSVLVFVVAASLATVSAVSDDERTALREAMAPIIAECSTEHGVSEAEVEAAKEAYSADAIKPCFMGCVMKKIGVIDSKGLYDAEKGIDQLKNFIKNEEDLAKFEEISKKCTKVNDESVSDGTAGCDRAKLILACAIENKAEMPL